MKLYTEQDIHQQDSIYKTLYTDREDLVYSPLPWQKQGLGQTRSGYGAKLVSPYKINYCDKLYRVYGTCYSNASSHWFTVKGQRIYVN